MNTLGRLIAALALGAGLVAAPAAPTSSPVRAADLPRWTGSMDVYRAGSFSTQKTYLWCTAADVQIARNIVTRQSDHSQVGQNRYFYWMRARNRYDIPLKDGVDPQGWAAGMREFVDDRYRLVTFRSFTAAVRSAATSLRLTHRPVGIIVASGEHAWLMTGFSATADPAVTSRFTVTSARVVGPLYGLQSRNGYDMPPDTRLSALSLSRFFDPFDDAYVRMIWKGLYVTIQAVPTGDAGTAARALHPAHPMAPRSTPVAPSSASEPSSADTSSSSSRTPKAQIYTDMKDLPRDGHEASPKPTTPTATPLPVAASMVALAAVIMTAMVGLARRHRKT